MGWHTFNRLPEDLPAPLSVLERLLVDEGRSRAEIQVTVCPYFHELTVERLEAYAGAGVDVVAALAFQATEADVGPVLDGLTDCLERARTL